MTKVRVWNENSYPYKENFKGEFINIPPYSYIEMEKDEAVLFKGTFCEPKYDAGGGAIPSSFKKIRIGEIGEIGGNESVPEIKPRPFKCQVCGFEGENTIELDKHINEKHLDVMVDQKEKERRTKAKK